MTPDPLERLIRVADGADTPQPPADLAQRVRRRAEQQQRRSRAIRLSASAVAVLIAAAISIRLMGPWQSTAPPLNATQIAQLRHEADELGARADLLKRQLDQARAAVARQELRDEYQRLAAAARDEDPTHAAIDRAASIPVTEGDFLIEVRGDRDDARAAYKRTIDYFPESHWAAVARERIEQLNMN